MTTTSRPVDALGERVVRLQFGRHLAVVGGLRDDEILVRDDGRHGMAELIFELTPLLLGARRDAREDDLGALVGIVPVLENGQCAAHVVHLVGAVDHRAEIRHGGVLRGGDGGWVEARRHIDEQVAEEAPRHADDVLELRDGDLVDVVRLRRAAEHVNALGDGHVVALERHRREEADVAGRLDDGRLRREVEEDRRTANPRR